MSWRFILLGCVWGWGMLGQAMWAGAEELVYQGKNGPGKGKHIVFIAADHEYRSEESLPALARILARHYGFQCTVLFSVDPKSGEIDPAASNIPGMEALSSADLMVNFTRFQNPSAEQMKPFVAYLERGGPVVGLRTATHGFKIPNENPLVKYSYHYTGDDYKGGFGRQVLGETWVGHYGTNHKQSTRLDMIQDQAGHPVLQGVKDMWVQAGAYFAKPMENSTILAMAQPLNGMTPDSPADEKKAAVPGVWVREYQGAEGKKGRVFTTTYGASEDILNDGFRRLLVNACLWAVGLEESIKPDSKIDFVGPYQPTTFRGGAWVKGVKPSDLREWNSPILPKPADKKAEITTQLDTSAPPFDGKTLEGWMTQDGKPVPSAWEVAEGEIHLKKDGTRAGHIVTRKEFGDFQLSFEWKIAPKGNSGIKYRVRSHGGKILGCEYQIYDDDKGKINGKNSAGSLYDLYEPNDQKELKPVGEYNHSRIVVRGDKIEHWLNGKLIVEAQVGSEEWQTRVDKSKFNDVEDFSRRKMGRLMLTDHGSEVWYRNFEFEEFADK